MALDNASPTISPQIADLLVKKHGFKMQENKLLGPSGTLIPVAMHEGGVVHTHAATGEEVRTLDEASGYGGQQYTVDETGAFSGLYTAPPPMVPAPPPPMVPAPPPPMQTMQLSKGPTHFDPVSAPPPAAPVAPAAPVSPDLGTPPPAPGPGGVIATDAPAAPAQTMITDPYGMPLVNKDPETGEIATDAPAAPVAPPADVAPAPTQTREDLVTALDEAVQTDTETFKYGTGDKTGKTVTFADGSVLTQRGFSFKYEDADGNPIELDLPKRGIKTTSNESKNKAREIVVSGIKSKFTEDVYGEFGGKEGDLVSEYLADKKAEEERRKKIEKRQDAAEAERKRLRNEQVKKEAERLGITTDQYYGYDAEGKPVEGGLSFSDRLKMAGQDIAEVFDPSLGPLTVPYARDDDPASETFGQVVPQIDPENARNLGVLGDYQLPSPEPTLPMGGPGTFAPGALPAAPVQDGSLIPQAVAAELLPSEELLFTTSASTKNTFEEFSAEDIDTWARTIVAEAGGELDAGQIAAANVMLNRYNDPAFNKGGMSLTEILTAPKQFSAWNDINEGGNNPQNIDTNSTEYQKALDIISGILNKQISDNTAGATHYWNDSVASPDWGDEELSKHQTGGLKIGNHTFAGKTEQELLDERFTLPTDSYTGTKAQQAGFFDTLSRFNPFGSAEAATIPSDQLPPGYAEQLALYGAGKIPETPQDFGGPSFTPDFDYVAPGMSPGAMGKMANPAVLSSEQNRLLQGAGDLFSNDLEYNIAGGLAEETGQALEGLGMTADEIAEYYARQDPMDVYDANNPRRFFQTPLKAFSGYDPYEVDPSLLQALRGTDIPGFSGVADQGAAPTYEQQNPDINIAKQFVSPTDPDRFGLATYLEEAAEGIYDKISPEMQLRQEQALPEEGTTLTDVLTGNAKDRLGRTYGTDFVATAMTGGQEVGDLVVDGLVLAVTKNPALAFGTVATTSYGAAAQSASEQGRALVRAGLESGEIQNSPEFQAAVQEFGSEERAIKQLLDRVDEYSKTAGTVGAIGDVVLAKLAGVLPGSSLVPKVVKSVPNSVKTAGKTVVQTGKSLTSGGASGLTEAVEGALANVGAQQAGSPVDIMTGTGADALLGYGGGLSGQTVYGTGQALTSLATSTRNALSDDAIIEAAKTTTIDPDTRPNIVDTHGLNIQSLDPGVSNVTPFNVDNLSNISSPGAPGGISTLQTPTRIDTLQDVDTTQQYTESPNYLYGVGPTLKSSVSPGGIANIPAGDTAVNFPSNLSTLQTPNVDQEAIDVIAKVDAGSLPFAMTNNLLRILRNNNIPADANTDPAEAIAALKVKASSAPSGAPSLSTLETSLSNVTPPLPYQQAQQTIIQEIVETGGLSVDTANRLSNDFNLSMPEISQIAENAMGLDISTPGLADPAQRVDKLPNVGSTLADTRGIGSLLVSTPPVGKVTGRDKDTGQFTPAEANPVKSGIASDPNLLSMPADTDVTLTTDTDVVPAVDTTDVDTTTTVDVDPIPPLATVDVPPEQPVEVDVPVDEDVTPSPPPPPSEEDEPPFECPDGFTAVKVEGQWVCMPDEEEDDGAGTVIQRVRPRIAPYYQPQSVAALSGYTPYRPR